MANYTSCKIYLEKRTGELDLDLLKAQISRLKEENNIFQTIEAFVCIQNSCLELRFCAKRYPHTIDEIFSPVDYNMWIIGSDEGGASDYIKYQSSKNSLVEETQEKALYKFDEIEVQGNVEKIKENLEVIFGWGMKYHGHRQIKEDTISIPLAGIYKSNNYFSKPDDNEINMNLVESLPFRDKPSNRTEFWEFIWEIDGIDFQDKFYKEMVYSSGQTASEYLSSLRFKYKGELTNEFVWNGNYWEHYAINDFHNCVNANLLLFRALNILKTST